MDTNAKQKIELIFDTLPNQTKKAFDFLSDQNWLKNSRWWVTPGQTRIPEDAPLLINSVPPGVVAVVEAVREKLSVAVFATIVKTRSPLLKVLGLILEYSSIGSFEARNTSGMVPVTTELNCQSVKRTVKAKEAPAV